MLKYVAEVDFSGASRSVSITTLTHQSKTRPGPVAGVLGRVPLAGLFAPRARPRAQTGPTRSPAKIIDNRTRNEKKKRTDRLCFEHESCVLLWPILQILRVSCYLNPKPGDCNKIWADCNKIWAGSPHTTNDTVGVPFFASPAVLCARTGGDLGFLRRGPRPGPRRAAHSQPNAGLRGLRRRPREAAVRALRPGLVRRRAPSVLPPPDVQLPPL